MAEEKIKGIMRNLVKAMVKKDVDKALSFLADDADWVTPMGTFKGREEVKRYLTWMTQSTPDLAIKESGIGIIAQGDKAFYEHVLEGTLEGMKLEVLAMCAYEFSDEKIQHLRTVYDRLSIAKQAAQGWLATKAVNSIIKHMEKGLR